MCLAVPGKVVSMQGEDRVTRMGKVSFSGVIREVSLACVPEAEIDSFVIVHAGMAIGVLDEEEAARVLTDLAAMDSSDGTGGLPE